MSKISKVVPKKAAAADSSLKSERAVRKLATRTFCSAVPYFRSRRCMMYGTID